MKESFSNLYTRLYNENITELEALRKKEKTKALAILIPILSMFVVVMLMPFLAFLLLPLMMVVIIVAVIKSITGKSNKVSSEMKYTAQYI